MKISRRVLLAGGGALVLAAGGLAWRATSRGVFEAGEGPAYAPWRNWRSDKPERPLALVRAAILAASPHNTQPWLFQVREDAIDLLVDPRRNIGAMDPFAREQHIGLGCAIENMVQAAGANGYAVKLLLAAGRLDGLRPPAPQPVARLLLTRGDAGESPLYRAIPLRHTNRGPYDGSRAAPGTALAVLAAMTTGSETLSLFLFSKGEPRKRFAELTLAATEAIVADAAMVHDSDAWFRITPDAIAAHRDGVTLDAAGLPPLVRAIVKMLPTPSSATANKAWLEATRDTQLPTAPVTGIIAVRDLYDRVQALSAGQLWQRMHLWATKEGLAMQPLNQAMERVDRERQLGRPAAMAAALARLIGDPGWTPTFGFRLGYPIMAALPSPRRALASVLV